MEVLNRMAYLILEDPFITAAELSQKLGYSEEKTIYYWLAKAHYQGLQAFKRAVVGGRFRLPAQIAKETVSQYGRLPVLDGFNADGKPILTKESLSGSLAANVLGKMAWRYHGPSQGPVQSGDLLLLSPLRDEDPAKWVLAGSTKLPTVLMKVTTGTDTCYIRPDTCEIASFNVAMYRIVQIVRNLF
ncbi:hypothetical protein [Sulfobacillus thermosulfidooxidans]|uniref:hypothetical protein n=1 Tax=Sulfobacillus thermosulfidooxidans TaxID=28034 RepID=UPI00096B8EE2|nr:hypothetical protein [Sulfobacillus thermosulfidooxidans]OLZ09680.1 hypothetical protein BFX05_12040 [Sulfobacillus thermosulfidooxidans]OLZ16013.1 hypothetical protein BFX06_03000 [Sulfobacillus thermosulfidooxidans]OLZ18139.1 hypothetical protein BFX07_07125 [Sulfobacillus thermosulfidooxidans]